MDDIFVTITGINHYYGFKPFSIGSVLHLEKDSENELDSEAIKATLPYIGTVGYVANTPNTCFKGTYSSGRLYDKMGKSCKATVLFITHSSVIAKVEFVDNDTVNF